MTYLFYFIIIFLALSSLYFNCLYFFDLAQIYADSTINDNNEGFYKTEFDSKKIVIKSVKDLINSEKPLIFLSIREKLLLIDFWFVFCMIGNFIQIWVSIDILFKFLFETTLIISNDKIEVLLGFSCAFAWINWLR